MKKNSKIKKDLSELSKDVREILNFKFPNINTNYVLIFLFVAAAFLFGFVANDLWGIKKTDLSTQPRAQVPVGKNTSQQSNTGQANLAKIQNEVIKNDYVLKIKWNDLGQKLIADGVIDKQKLAKAVTGTDSLPQNMDKYLTSDQTSIELNQQNAQFWVDVLWGLGLANNNPILNSGPMAHDGNTANFASTGGYTIGVNKPMDIYSKFSYINLSSAQEQRVQEIASNIYRPCCDNPTSFPDCNHGMAALALIELMVSQNFSDTDIYNAVLAFNTYWFPQTYLNTAYYFQLNGRDYGQVSAKEILSKTFSSASGSQVISKRVGNINWPALQGGGSCGA